MHIERYNIFSYLYNASDEEVARIRQNLRVYVKNYRYMPFNEEYTELVTQIKDLLRKEIPKDKILTYMRKSYRNFNHIYGNFPEIIEGVNWKGYFHFLYKTATGYKLPSGLLEYIRDIENLRIIDKRKAPKPIENRCYTLHGIEELRDYQREALDSVLDNGCGIVDMSIRGGKTAFMASVLNNLSEKAVLFYLNTTLIEQVKENLESYLKEPIGVFHGKEQQRKRINLIGVQYALNNKGLINTILKEANIILCDEVHHSQATSYVSLLRNCDAYYRIGCSGTADGNSPYDKMKIQAYLGPKIHLTTTADLAERGLVADVKTYFIKNTKIDQPLPQGISDPKKRKFLYNIHYNKGIVENKYRNSLIIDIANYFKKQVYIIVERLKHGEFLSEALSAPFISGQIESIKERQNYFDAFDRQEIPVLIVNRVAAEGVDIENIRYLIYAAGYKSAIKTIQSTGRALTHKKTGDNKAFIFDFTDSFSHFLRRHAIARYKIYKQRGDKVLGPFTEDVFRKKLGLSQEGLTDF